MHIFPTPVFLTVCVLCELFADALQLSAGKQQEAQNAELLLPLPLAAGLTAAKFADLPEKHLKRNALASLLTGKRQVCLHGGALVPRPGVGRLSCS